MKPGEEEGEGAMIEEENNNKKNLIMVRYLNALNKRLREVWAAK